MLDIVEYLESKNLEVFRQGSDNVHTHCFFCDEDTDKAGRLYVNVNEDSEKFGLSYCFLCNHSTNLNGLLRHFGDDPINEDIPAPEFSPILEEATQFYHECLMNNVEAFDFLVEERGLSEQTIISARLGWAPGGSELHGHLIKSFSPEELLESQLTNRFSQDFFKEEIIIPYLDYGRTYNIRGKKIGGKYRGLPNTGVSLYGTDSVIGEKTVLITEGEFCALHLQQLGFHAVGVPGAQTWKDDWHDVLEEVMRAYILFDNDKAGKAGAEKLSAKLGPKSRVVEVPKKGYDIEDYIVKLGKNKEDIDYLLSKAKGGILVTVDDAFSRWREIEGNPNIQGLKFNVDSLDLNMNHGLLPGQLITLISKTGVGKSQPVSSLLPSPNGPIKMGDISIGDRVFGADGLPVEVIGVYDRGYLDTYRVTFSDKTFLDVGADHIWSVSKRTGRSRSFSVWENKTTLELEGDLKYRREFKWIIPLTKPVEYEKRVLPIEPYTLGAVIANGNTTQSSTQLTTPDRDVASRCRSEGYDLTLINDQTDGVCERYIIRNTIGKFRSIGLTVKSSEKFIPRDYLTSSVDQRVALLQGLMDGDGSSRASQQRRSVYYFTTSIKLAANMIELVNSLGGTATMSKDNRSSGSGNTTYRLNIMMPHGIYPFSSKRKNLKVNSTYKTNPKRAIVSIEKVGTEEHRCIKVNADDSLYLGSYNYTVTHNTAFMVNMIHRMKMVRPDLRIMFFSLEQTRNEIFDRMHKINCFYNPTAQPIDTADLWRDGFLMVDKNMIKEDDVVDSIYQFAYELGEVPHLFIMDYLGYFARGCRGNSEYERTTNAVMDLKAICKDMQVVGFAPHQANRSGRFGEELAADQAKSSGAVEETSDVLISMWSPDAKEGIRDEDKTGEVHQRIKKNRNGPANMIARYQWAPLTMAMVPLEDINYVNRAAKERKYAAAGDTLEQALMRHAGGGIDLSLT